MVVRVEAPVVQVRLSKATGINFTTGQVYRGASAGFDGFELTPFLGDSGSIRTHKSLNEPCGAFSITFADRMSDVGQDTVYALAEAMDIIEIRMGRYPMVAPFPSGEQPLIMRGYISEIRRDETIAPDGTPHTSVTILGQDSAKLWFNWSILPEAHIASDNETMLATFSLFAASGIRTEVMPVSEFVAAVNDQMMTPRVEMLSNFSGWDIPPFNLLATVPEGRVWPGLFDSFMMGGGGRYWDILEWCADRPWNELFVRDNPETEIPDLIFRPVPYFDEDGGLIMPGAEAPPIIDRDVGDIVSVNMSRNDHKVANFYWVPPVTPETQYMNSISALTREGGGLDGPLFSVNHDNSNMALYGLRKMMHSTRLLPTENPMTVAPNVHLPDSRLEAGRNTTAWHIIRAEQLNLLNRDNSVWDSARMTLKGMPDLLIGYTLRWIRGQRPGTGFQCTGYITDVEHEFRPLRAGGQAHWLTHLNLERCNNFLERDAAGGSPRILEGWRGPYNQ